MATGRSASRRSSASASWVLCCCCFLALAFGPERAAADPGPEFVPPNEQASEPTLPEMAACPVPELDELYEAEEDLAARQVTLLREELVAAIGQSCRAQTDRQDELIRRTWWVVTQLLGEHAEAVGAGEWLSQIAASGELRNEHLQAMKVALQEGPLPTQLVGVDAENPLPVSGLSGGEGSPEETAELVASIDAAGEGTIAAVYIVAGLIAALFIGAALARTVDRGT
jgi:hypothetical protein